MAGGKVSDLQPAPCPRVLFAAFKFFPSGQGAKTTQPLQGLAVMALPPNIAPSLKELASLSDEIWFLAGDTSVDTSWYTKRATLSAIYSSAEIFMTTDTSANFTETEEFLDRRLEEARVVGAAVGNVGQWVGFTATGFVNLLRNKGVRI